jgi:MSHA pilin protein MshC
MRTQRGFTMAELIIVMVITGVLAAVAVPRMLDTDQLSARGARDLVGSAIRYAQKSAIAMRHNVCVDITATQVNVRYANASGAGQGCPPTGNDIVNPGNGLPYGNMANKLPGNATVTSPVSFIFDAQGRPLSAPSIPMNTALTIAVTGYATPLIIEPETGTVH